MDLCAEAIIKAREKDTEGVHLGQAGHDLHQ